MIEDREELQHLAPVLVSTPSPIKEPTNTNTNNTTTTTTTITMISYTASMMLIGMILYKTILDLPNSPILFSIHPISMTIGWTLLASSAIHTITSADFLTSWMPTKSAVTRHWILQLAGFSFIAIGLCGIVANKIAHDKSHFTSVHGVSGLVTVLFAAFSGSVGVAALYSAKLKKLLAPIYLKLVHSALGILTYCMAFLTIVLGLSGAWMSGDPMLQSLCLLLLVMVTVSTLLRPSIKLFVRTRERIEYVNSVN